MKINTNPYQPLIQHLGFTSIAAISATIAATASSSLQFQVWAMFIGWVAYLTRGHNIKAGMVNLICVWLGIALGFIATLGFEILGPVMHEYTLPLMIFIVAMIVVSLRDLPILNNLLCYFLGLISVFASHSSPSILNILALIGPISIGAFAAWITVMLQQKLTSVK
ncbi:MAG: hypothetical protein COA95_09150 [Methylophaga sp.]|nr:MAG: hypothetical protein COA95_09150 [Methylophaga sp.]